MRSNSIENCFLHFDNFLWIIGQSAFIVGVSQLFVFEIKGIEFY